MSRNDEPQIVAAAASRTHSWSPNASCRVPAAVSINARRRISVRSAMEFRTHQRWRTPSREVVADVRRDRPSWSRIPRARRSRQCSPETPRGRIGRVARWQGVIDSEPELAAEVQAVFDAHKHKLIATLRRDGSPRISGIEFEFTAGDVSFGMMPRSRKRDDLRGDQRVELHSMSILPEGDELAWRGSPPISRRALRVPPPGGGS